MAVNVSYERLELASYRHMLAYSNTTLYAFSKKCMYIANNTTVTLAVFTSKASVGR